MGVRGGMLSVALAAMCVRDSMGAFPLLSIPTCSVPGRSNVHMGKPALL